MPKFYPYLVLLFLSPATLLAQGPEMRLNLNSGFFSFRGDKAESVSFINNESYTNNPYGRKGGLSYGLSFDLRKASQSGFLFGANLGYEMLRSKVDLEFTGVIMGDILADFEGKTYLNNSFINVFPYLGKRFPVGPYHLDLTGGLDLAYVLSSREKGKAEPVNYDKDDIKTSVDRKNVNTDIRPRLQLSLDVEKIGIYVGYSYGLRNYLQNMEGPGTWEAYSRMWRLGLTYRVF